MFKFTPVKARDPSAGIQISEIEFQKSGRPVSAKGCTATSPGGSTVEKSITNGEEPQKAIDGTITTKWLNGNENMPLLVSCPAPIAFDKYTFVTGNDVSTPPFATSTGILQTVVLYICSGKYSP